MKYLVRVISLASLVVALGFLSSTAEAGSFNVADSDFVNDVYEFHYYTFPNTAPNALAKRTVINGVDQSISDPTLAKSGWEFGDLFTPNIGFWAATGAFSATNTYGEITMGWDFSTITGQIEKVELKTRNFLFQFSPWTTHAVGDEIAGFVATPNSFGTGNFTQLYSFVGNNTTGTIGSALIEDITSSFSDSWLMNPGLLELKFTYSQIPSPTIPGRHIQIFRDNTGIGDDGFLLRVTLVQDADGDGVPDDVDACFDSDLSQTVVIDGCDSSVANMLFDDGCTIADLIDELASSASNHGDFVSAVAHLTNDLKKDGVISGEEKGMIQSCGAEQAGIP